MNVFSFHLIPCYRYPAKKDDPVLSTRFTWLKQKQRPYTLTPFIKPNFFYIHIRNNSNYYLLTQTHIVSNILHPTLNYLKKSLPKLKPLLPKHVVVHCSNFSMLLLTNPIHIATSVKNSLLKPLISFNIFLFNLYGFLISFMTVLNAKRTNTFLINQIILSLLYHFMKMPFIPKVNLHGH